MSNYMNRLGICIKWGGGDINITAAHLSHTNMDVSIALKETQLLFLFAFS